MSIIAQACGLLEKNLVEVNRDRIEIASLRRKYQPWKIHLAVALALVMGVFVGCAIQSGKPLTPAPNLANPIAETKSTAVELHSDAKDIKSSTADIRHTAITAPKTLSTKGPADLDRIDHSADRVDAAATRLENNVVVPLEKASADVKQITTERDQAAAAVKTAEAARDKAIADKNSLIHKLLVAMTCGGILAIIAIGALMFTGGPTKGEIVALVSAAALVVLSSVVNVYYEKLAMWGMIGIGVAILGGLVLLGIKLWQGRQANGMATELTQFVELFKSDVATVAPDKIKTWFDNGSLSLANLFQTDKLTAFVKELKASGTVKPAAVSVQVSPTSSSSSAAAKV